MTHITDDDDNLIKLGEDGPADDWFERPDLPEIKNDEWTEEKYTEEWTETPKGHAKLDIDLDPDVISKLITFWSERLSAASKEQFDEVLADEGVEAAVYSAVLNELIIECLQQQIERVEAEQADDT